MEELDKHLFDINNNSKEIIYNDLLNDYQKYNYEDEDDMALDLNLLLEIKYKKIKQVESKKELDRRNQKTFKKHILKKFNNKCIISGNDCKDELEGAHIIPLSDHGSYDINNGLLLASTLHKTFDKYYWSINPNTLIIETKNNINIGSIKNYVGNKVNLELNDNLRKSLEYHYIIFNKLSI